VFEDVSVGCEDVVAEPVVSHELPQGFDRVEFGGAGQQRQQSDVGGHSELLGGVPASLIEQQDGMRTGRDSPDDLFKAQGHRFGGAAGHDKAGPGASDRADAPKV
jgi:hypothetical protein